MEGNDVWLWKCGFDAQNSSDSGFLCEFRTTELTAKSFQKYLHSTFSQLPNIYLAKLSTTYLLSQNLEELSSLTY